MVSAGPAFRPRVEAYYQRPSATRPSDSLGAHLPAALTLSPSVPLPHLPSSFQPLSEGSKALPLLWINKLKQKLGSVNRIKIQIDCECGIYNGPLEIRRHSQAFARGTSFVRRRKRQQ